MKKQRIGIIGAGQGGLMLGLLLQQQGHDVSIYEEGALLIYMKKVAN